VLLIPRISYKREATPYSSYSDELDSKVEDLEWPPSPCTILFVFSSRTGQWHERIFLGEGKLAGTVANMRLTFLGDLGRGEASHADCRILACRTLRVLRG
jgi:hypothetical protein